MYPVTLARLATILALVVIAHPPVFAAPPQYYVGGAIGVTQWPDDASRLTTEAVTTMTAATGRSTIGNGTQTVKSSGVTVFGGAWLSPTWAVEGGYADFGKTTFTATTTDGVNNSTWNGSVRVNAWYGSVLGAHALSTISRLYGKAGLYRATTESTANVNAVINGVASAFGATITSNNTGWLLGAGWRYGFSPTLAMTVELVQFHQVGDSDNLWQETVGLTYSF